MKSGFFFTMNQDQLETLLELVNSAEKIVITAHKSPDGDSVGSSLGLYHFLKQFEAEVKICHPDESPHFLHWMPAVEQIKSLDKNKEEVKTALQEADLIFCLDYNSSSRIGKMEQPLLQSSAKRVMIDHHRDPDTEFCDLMFSDITSCSTAQLIYEIIVATGYEKRLNKDVAVSLYTGLVTDTGSFRFSSTLPKTMRIAAALMETGIEHWRVHEQIFNANSLDRIQLNSYAMLEKLQILADGKAAYVSLTDAELKRFNAQKGDTEGLVNQALSIAGVQMAVFLKESDGIIKCSFRSQGDIPVNELASNHFSGGGHLNAAGGKFLGKMEDAIEKLVTLIPKFVEEHKQLFE